MDSAALYFLLPALCLCLILAGIHVYLGIHVLSRGVIFVDLALAQIAALGSAVALLWEHSESGPTAYLISLGFTLMGAVLFALSRGVEKKRIPQEAVIGVTYAVSSALIVLLMDKASHGAEHIKGMLVGGILWVSWAEVLATFLLYVLVGAFHYAYRDRFFLISTDPDAARHKGYHLKVWDLLFYASFGLVITSSVKIAGVLLVFSYLVVPAMIGQLFATTIRGRLAVGWGVGFAVSVAGLLISYLWDLPTGASLVALFGLVLVGGLCVFPIISRH